MSNLLSFSAILLCEYRTETLANQNQKQQCAAHDNRYRAFGRVGGCTARYRLKKRDTVLPFRNLWVLIFGVVCIRHDYRLPTGPPTGVTGDPAGATSLVITSRLLAVAPNTP